MKMITKPWIFYAVALFCFLLPFGNISCSEAPGKIIAKASGVQVILDQITFIDSKPPSSDSDKSNFPPMIRVLAAVPMLILAIGIMYLLLRPTSYSFACGIGVVVAICLVVGLLIMKQAASEEGFIVSPAYGWWLSLLLSLAGSARIAVHKFLENKSFFE